LRNFFLLLLLLPALGRAQKILAKSITQDTLVLNYDRDRATECVSVIIEHYHRLVWIKATVTTNNDNDSIKTIKLLVHANIHGRVDSIYQNGNFITLNDKHIKFQGGYLCEFMHGGNTVLWTRVYITTGSSIKEYAIAMEFKSYYIDQ
jgi:hypothetical protein